MSRNKLKKFAELNKFSNVAQVSQIESKDKLDNFLNTKKDIVLELGCGKGEYTLAMARLYPDKKFIGIDIQGERIWYGATAAKQKKLSNVFFLRIQIESIMEYFKENSISEIWISFPDPFLREGQIKKRLTSPRFLTYYKKLFKKNALLNIKTDNKIFYEYSLESIKLFGALILKSIENIYQNPVKHELLKIKTFYEKKHLENNKKIYYIQAKID